MKLVSALWNASYQVKKTPDSLILAVNRTTEDGAGLQDDYEQLRTYALSPAEATPQPLGLDLWIKKGFLSWIEVMLRGDQPAEPADFSPARLEEHDVSDDLLISLANILIEWSATNGGLD